MGGGPGRVPPFCGKKPLFTVLTSNTGVLRQGSVSGKSQMRESRAEVGVGRGEGKVVSTWVCE